MTNTVCKDTQRPEKLRIRTELEQMDNGGPSMRVAVSLMRGEVAAEDASWEKRFVWTGEGLANGGSF